jgi:1-aminocyclopropane-1-carboxylate deaminase/D-cysteine desulfhydrase-like pyridoxal-dependent ACC family enzyme
MQIEIVRTRLNELDDAIACLPRVALAHLPTPLDETPRLSRDLGGIRILVKREDATGLALGGNKTRMFEFVLGKVLREGYDTVVTGAAAQSNYCRQLAAACARLGLDCHLVLRRVRGAKDDVVQGSLLVDLLCGASVSLVDGDWRAVAAGIRSLGEELCDQGRKVYTAQLESEVGLGLYAVAYCAMFTELFGQLEAREIRIDRLWLCSADTTQAGLALANKHVGAPFRVTGVSPLPAPIYGDIDSPALIATIANEAAEILGITTRLEPSDVENLCDYVGEDYGKVTPEGLAALHRLARLEGLLLDPVYTAKAMAGLIDQIERGRIESGEAVVFVHTGGTPALFAYSDELGVRLGALHLRPCGVGG